MKKSGQNLVGIVVLLLVIAVAIAFAIKVSRPKQPPYLRSMVDWTCEECGHRFVKEPQQDPRACPECSGEAVSTYYYYCSVHNHLFEAFRTKPDPDVDPNALRVSETGKLRKFPGGEWTKYSLGYPIEITCPEGNSDPETLKYCPPGAEER